MVPKMLIKINPQKLMIEMETNKVRIKSEQNKITAIHPNSSLFNRPLTILLYDRRRCNFGLNSFLPRV